MDSPLNLFFAKQVLGSDFSEEKAQFIASVMQGAREGHLCIKCSEAPSLPLSVLEEGKAPFPKTPLVRDQDRYYLQKNWVYETFLVEQIGRLQKQKMGFDDDVLFQEKISQESSLSAQQKTVVEHMFANPFSVVCGGPGTGKTYTAGVFVRLLSSMKQKYRIAVAAPTGKAALHLQSSLLSKGSLGSDVAITSSTLHRLLHLKPGETNLFTRKGIDADLIIVDEASMMDVSLLAHLLGCVREGTRLILMGDPNQLPPVEEAGVFAELADLFGVFLKKCMRTEDPLLHRSAEAILNGDADAFFASTSISEDLDISLLDRLYEKIHPWISSERMDPMAFLQNSSRFRVLNALRQGPLGLEAMNQKILERMEKKCKEGEWWAVPILVTANAPHHNLYNGSMGVLIGRKKKGLKLCEGTAYFPETAGLPLLNPPPYEVSFVLSIHKSHGAEFDEVMVLLPQGSEHFGKEALYTAATRAKKKWEVVGTKDVVKKMLSQNSRKISGLIDRVKAATPVLGGIC